MTYKLRLDTFKHWVYICNTQLIQRILNVIVPEAEYSLSEYSAHFIHFQEHHNTLSNS